MNHADITILINDIVTKHGKELLFAIGTISVVNWSWPLYSAAVKRTIKKRLFPLLREFLLYVEQQQKQFGGSFETDHRRRNHRSNNHDDFNNDNHDYEEVPPVMAFVIILRLFHILGTLTGGVIGYALGKLCYEAGIVTQWAPSVGAVLGSISGLGAIFVCLPFVSVVLARQMNSSNDNCSKNSSLTSTTDQEEGRGSDSCTEDNGQDESSSSISRGGQTTKRSNSSSVGNKEDWWDKHEQNPTLAFASYFQTAVIVQARNRLYLETCCNYCAQNKQCTEQTHEDGNGSAGQGRNRGGCHILDKSKLAKAEKHFLFAFSIILTWLSLNTACFFEWLCVEWDHENERRSHVLVVTAILWIPIMYVVRFIYAVRLYRKIRRKKGKPEESVKQSVATLFVRPMIRNACDLFMSTLSLPSFHQHTRSKEENSSCSCKHAGVIVQEGLNGQQQDDIKSYQDWYIWRSPDGHVANTIPYWKLYFVIMHGFVVGPAMGIMFGYFVGKMSQKYCWLWWGKPCIQMSYVYGVCSGIAVSVGSLYALIFHSGNVLHAVLGRSVTQELCKHMELMESNLFQHWALLSWHGNKQKEADKDDNTKTRKKAMKNIVSSVVLVGKLNVQSQAVEDVATGFFVDSKRGLIMTALHTFCNMEKLGNGDHDGDDATTVSSTFTDISSSSNLMSSNLDVDMKGFQVIVGIITQKEDDRASGGDEAKFMYTAEIIAAGSKGVDACLLRITGNVSASCWNDCSSLSYTTPEQESMQRKNIRSLEILQPFRQMVDLKLQTSCEVEDQISLIGFDQDGDGLLANEEEKLHHIGRRVGIRMGYVSRKRNTVDKSLLLNSDRFIPRSEILVICAAKKGNSGGPCLNEKGEVIGMCSRIDPLDVQRCYLVPSKMLKELYLDNKHVSES